MRVTKAQRLVVFTAIAFLGSWALALVFHLVGGRIEGPEGRAISILYVVPPAIAAMVVQGPLAKRPLLDPLGLRPRFNGWVLLGWVLPLLVLGVALALYAVLPGLDVVTSTEQYVEQVRTTLPTDGAEDFEGYLADHAPPHPALLLVYGLLGGVVNVLFGLAEELAWRGYLPTEIEGGFWRRSVVTGLVWGIWLVPWVLSGYLYPDHRVTGAFLVFGYTLLWSPALVLLRFRSGTIWAPALTRGTLMALALPASQLAIGGDDRIKPFPGLLGLLALAIVVGLLIAASRRPSAA